MAKASKLKRVVLLAFEDAQILDITGPLQVLGSANRAYGSSFYEIVLAASRPGPFRTSLGVNLIAEAGYSDSLLRGIDTLIVAGGEGVDRAVRDKTL
ncbi:MAG TPA: GlxA family transcriptional regulator, partial [Candidatus Binatia bacterium]|nr:GlxA family transcriptional regulator [Candidatus Binatia bacterium]